MFKKVLNNKKGSVEIIVWLSVVMVIITMLFVLRTSILDVMNSTSDAINNLTVNSAVDEEVEKPIIEEPVKEEPVKKEEPIVTPVVEKSLWDEIKVEVIAGVIVSILGFSAGQLYSKFKHKKELKIDDRLKTLNLNKYDI